MDEQPMKRCSRCKEQFPATSEFFVLEKRRKDGIGARCRICDRKQAETRRRKNGVPIRHSVYRADGKKRCSRCGEYFEPTTEYFCRSKYDSSGLSYYCRKCMSKHTARYKKMSKYRLRAKERLQYPHVKLLSLINREKRRSRKLSLDDSFNVKDWQRCLEYWNHRCCVCGRQAGLWHILAQDHWIPLSDPRPDNPGTTPINVVPLCHVIKDGENGCNNSKRNKDATEWLTETYGKRKAKQILKRIEAYFEWVKQQPD